MGYSKQIVRGFSWSAILNFTSMVSGFVKVIILSRFVFGPTEFGVFGVGVLVLGILELITETGINIFLVQETDPVKKYLNTAWVISILRGILISLTLIVLSYPIAVFFKITNNWSFIIAFALLPLLRGFINPAIANLQKNLKFREEAIYRFTVSTVEDVAIVILAIFTHNIFSFVVGMLIGATVEVAITFIFIKEKPKFLFERVQFRKIVNLGKWVTLAQIFDYLYRHTDDITVGRILNVASLGLYQNSYTLSSLPENAVAQQLGKITFPVFVNIKEDKVRVKRAFVITFVATLAIILPFGLILFFLSDTIVNVFLGPKWIQAIPVLKILALFGIVRAMTNLFYPVFLAFKKQSYVMTTTFVSWIVLGIIIIPLTQNYGITGAATSALIGTLSGLPVAFYLYGRLLYSK